MSALGSSSSGDRMDAVDQAYQIHQHLLPQRPAEVALDSMTEDLVNQFVAQVFKRLDTTDRGLISLSDVLALYEVWTLFRFN